MIREWDVYLHRMSDFLLDSCGAGVPLKGIVLSDVNLKIFKRRIVMRGKNSLKLCGLLFLAALVVGLGALPLQAQVTIPQGSVINSAMFRVFIVQANQGQVSLHRITTEWAETAVTYNSFANSYAAESYGGFAADTAGVWKEVDITGLVQAWAAGVYPNYGIAMLEPEVGGNGNFSLFWSSEYTLDYRPQLVIGYTPPGGSLTYVTIRRPGSVAEQVVDTVIMSNTPDTNYGTNLQLGTRHPNPATIKYSLIRFIFSYTPPDDHCPGTGTPGYWMNHPEAWPEDFELGFCGDVLDQAIAIEWMKRSVSQDKFYTMFSAWVAAKLNAAIGCPTVCPPDINIAEAIIHAEAWLCANFGTVVRAGGPNSPWRVGEPLYLLLDQYNNGLLCVPHRD